MAAPSLPTRAAFSPLNSQQIPLTMQALLKCSGQATVGPRPAVVVGGNVPHTNSKPQRVCSRRTLCAAQAEPKAEATNTSISEQSQDAPPVSDSSNSDTARGGFLSDPQQQAAAFGFLSATSLAFGAAALTVPELLLSVAIGGGGASALEVSFTRIAGATMAISAAAEYSLRVGCYYTWL